MRRSVVFDTEFDRGAWPGPLAGRAAAIGEQWLGPQGLVDTLETMLGLSAPYEVDAIRAAQIIPRLQIVESGWMQSAEHDPYGVASHILSMRDRLWLYGWRGGPLVGRFRGLEEMTADVSPGLPDRVLMIADELGKSSRLIDRLTILQEPSAFPDAWQRVLRGLEGAGTSIEVHTLQPATASGDVAAARDHGFRPALDGSLQLLRPPGVLQAAEDIAAWLARRIPLEDVVIVGCDTVLDDALHRFGLPTCGARTSVASNSVLQILPLVLALGWPAPDPGRALELLTLPVSPVPRHIASGLAGALRAWPAVDSDLWRESLAAGLATVEDDARRSSMEARLDVLLQPGQGVTKSLYAADAVRTRVQVLRNWMHGMAANEEQATALWEAGIAQCSALERLLDASQLSQMSPAILQRLTVAATESAPTVPGRASEAGIAGVASPGAVVGPARTIVWWDFCLGTEAAVEHWPMSTEEKACLRELNVGLPDPGDAAIARSHRWRRPLEQAREHLVLVCPRAGDDGEERFPHPFWDEIAGRLDRDVSRQMLEFHRPVEPDPMRETYTPLTLPSPAAEWKCGSIGAPDVISATALSELVACPFKHVAERVAGIRAGQTAKLPAGSELFGNLAHHVIGQTLLALPAASAGEAVAQALALLDTEGPRLAASLFQPGQDRDLGLVRLAIQEAVRVLSQVLREAGLQAQYMEETWRAQLLGAELSGKTDLVIGQPVAIVDLKWAGERYYQEALENGAAVQLAVYSRLLQAVHELEGMPPVAYFIISSQRTLAQSDSPLIGAHIVTGPTMSETWASLSDAFGRRCEQLANGDVAAPANIDEEDVSAVGETEATTGGLTLEAPCRFCDCGVLCGYAFREKEQS